MEVIAIIALLVVSVLLLCLVPVGGLIEYADGNVYLWRSIYIDPKVGIDNDSCLTHNNSNAPCKTLSFAFSNCSDYTNFSLLPGNTYYLTHEVSFKEITGLAFSGKGAEVSCSGKDVGLAFFKVQNVIFEEITFKYCGAPRNSTSKNFQSQNASYFSTFGVSLYFLHCHNVTMTNVAVIHSSNAAGVVMYDTLGTNSVRGCKFSNNSVYGDAMGGGGFHVELTYCKPGYTKCIKHASVFLSNFTFQNVTFSDNVAKNEGLPSKTSFLTPHQDNHQAFGRGGGLSFYFKGNAKWNYVIIDHCVFENNQAIWGAGAFIEFQDDVIGNHVTWHHCVFIGNKCNFTHNNGTGGGGMRLSHYVLGKHRGIIGHILRNHIVLESCEFSSNSAKYGGGISISSSLERIDEVLGNPAIITVKKVTFEKNIAKYGSAVNIDRFPFSTGGEMVQIIFENLRVINNNINYVDFLNLSGSPYSEGIGAFYVNQVNVNFRRSILFANNTGSGIAVAGATLNFSGSQVVFESNSGYRGGAIAMLGSAHLIVDNKTVMLFHSNVAEVNGGAINVRHVEVSTLTNCFIRHSEPFLQPNDWNVTFTFINNTDKNGYHPNSIHTTSVYPCAWAGGNSYSNDIGDIFCWNGWNYSRLNDEGNDWNYSQPNGKDKPCSKEITSEIGNIFYEKSNLDIIPGHGFVLPFQVSDDYNNDLTYITVFSSISNETSRNTSRYIWSGDETKVSGIKSDVSMNFTSLGDKVWRASLMLHLQQCPLGLFGENCSCPVGKTFGSKISCNPHSLEVTMKDQNWIGYFKQILVVGLCPSGFCKQAESSSILLPSEHVEVTDYIVCDGNRTEVLCGRCVNGYGHAVNSPTFVCVASPLDQLMASFSSAKW